MENQHRSGASAAKSNHFNEISEKPRRTWWGGPISYVKRKAQDRKAKKKQETPTDKAARRTATATFWIAGFTFVLAAVSYFQWRELQSSGRQTDQLIGLYRRQVAIAKEANNETHNLLAVTQGAVFRLLISYNQNEGINPWIGVNVENIGKTSARNFFGQSTFTRISESGRTVQSQRKNFSDDTVVVGGAPSAMFRVAPWSADPMGYRSERFIVDSKIQYDDGFGNLRRQNFCREMAVTQRQGVSWIECGNAKDWKEVRK